MKLEQAYGPPVKMVVTFTCQEHLRQLILLPEFIIQEEDQLWPVCWEIVLDIQATCKNDYKS